MKVKLTKKATKKAAEQTVRLREAEALAELCGQLRHKLQGRDLLLDDVITQLEEAIHDSSTVKSTKASYIRLVMNVSKIIGEITYEI